MNYIIEYSLRSNFNIEHNKPWKVVYYDEGLFIDNNTNILPETVNTVLFGEGCIVTGNDNDGYTVINGTISRDTDSMLMYGIRPYWYSNGSTNNKLSNWLSALTAFLDDYAYDNIPLSKTNDLNTALT